tara:strand:- start:399 stop:695 length:297 start_codon:yes stop_codon:yes gene_type:complete
MIISDYYQNYKGPDLIKATVNGDDITELILSFYGENNNWNGYLWSCKEIFNNDCLDKKFYCEFKSNDERIHWFKGSIDKLDDIFNFPLATPINQLKFD